MKSNLSNTHGNLKHEQPKKTRRKATTSKPIKSTSKPIATRENLKYSFQKSKKLTNIIQKSSIIVNKTWNKQQNRHTHKTQESMWKNKIVTVAATKTGFLPQKMCPKLQRIVKYTYPTFRVLQSSLFLAAGHFCYLLDVVFIGNGQKLLNFQLQKMKSVMREEIGRKIKGYGAKHCPRASPDMDARPNSVATWWLMFSKASPCGNVPWSIR